MINSGALEEGGGGIDFANIEKRTDSELESRFLDLPTPLNLLYEYA